MSLKVVALTISLIALFLAGWMSHDFYTAMKESVVEKPSNTFSIENNEILSPSNHVEDKHIRVYNDLVILDVKDASWSVFTDTHSMDPILSPRANGIEIKPTNEEDIQAGDIVAYNSAYAEGIIVHRVIDKKIDEKGTYYILKGDNNPSADPGKVRFEQIQGIVVAVVY